MTNVNMKHKHYTHSSCCWTDQFIFIKERDELVWNDLVESLKEAADLGTNGLSHSPLSHKLNVLTLEKITTICIIIIIIIIMPEERDKDIKGQW